MLVIVPFWFGNLQMHYIHFPATKPSTGLTHFARKYLDQSRDRNCESWRDRANNQDCLSFHRCSARPVIFGCFVRTPWRRPANIVQQDRAIARPFLYPYLVPFFSPRRRYNPAIHISRGAIIVTSVMLRGQYLIKSEVKWLRACRGPLSLYKAISEISLALENFADRQLQRKRKIA